MGLLDYLTAPVYALGLTFPGASRMPSCKADSVAPVNSSPAGAIAAVATGEAPGSAHRHRRARRQLSVNQEPAGARHESRWRNPRHSVGEDVTACPASNQ